MGKPFDKVDLSQSGLIFCSCLIFLFDFLDDVFVVSETLAILRIFLSHGPGTTCRYVERSAARHVHFFPYQKVNTPVWYAYVIRLVCLCYKIICVLCKHPCCFYPVIKYVQVQIVLSDLLNLFYCFDVVNQLCLDILSAWFGVYSKSKLFAFMSETSTG